MRILILLMLAFSFGAIAQPSLLLEGRAQTGEDMRAVRFEFFCSPNAGPEVTGALGVTMSIPHHDTLRATFDFDAFEGPDADAGIRTRVETSSGRTMASGRFAAGGWIGVDDDKPFAFGLAAARRRDAAGLAAVVRVLRPLTLGAARLHWVQENPRRGGPAIATVLEVSAEDSSVLRALLAPCLGG